MTDALCLLYTADRARLSGLSTQDNGDYMNPVFGEGPLTPNLMLIGEAPGREEAAAGHPFVGKAGRQLNELLELAGIARGDVFVTNAVKFRPVKRGARSVANRTPTAKELASGEELLKSEIMAFHPRYSHAWQQSACIHGKDKRRSGAKDRRGARPGYEREHRRQ